MEKIQLKNTILEKKYKTT